MSGSFSSRNGRDDVKSLASAENGRLSAVDRVRQTARRPSVFYRAAPNSPPSNARSARPAAAPATPGWYYLVVAFILVGGIGAMAQASRKSGVADLEAASAQQDVVSLAGLNTPRRLPADRFVKER